MAASAPATYHVSVVHRRSNVHSYIALFNALYWLALTLWVSVLVAAGVAATSVFTTLPDPELGVRLERFAEFEPERHGRIAAGIVMEPVFTFVDLMQFVMAGAVLVVLVIQFAVFRMPWRSPSNLLRTLGLLVAAGLLAGRMFTIAPEMNSNLRAYWQAAEVNDVESAARYQQAFEARHGAASAMFRGTLICLIVVVGASAVALGPAPRVEAEESLEKPRLSR